MKSYSVLLGCLWVVWFAACSGNSSQSDSGTDADLDAGVDGADVNDGDGGEAPDGNDGAHVDGGDHPGDQQNPRILHASTLLGEGGFFGVSAALAGQAASGPPGAFAIGAHYADISGGVGDPQPAGKLYFFPNGSFPENAGEAFLVLQPPDGSLGGGFGWALGNPCDFNNDTHLDFPVGNHLYTSPVTSNSGRVVVFWGDASGTLAMDRFSYHTLSDDLVRNSDSMAQTVLCADFNGDDYDDLLASGQNAGESDTGLGVIFFGSESGLPAHPDVILEPPLLVNRQYFGSASLYQDLDGDDVKDLAIGGWGLIKGFRDIDPHTGGVYVFQGGTDWSLGPAWGLFPDRDDETNMGAEMAFFDTGDTRFLAIGASDYGDPITGAVIVYEVGMAGFQNQAPVNILVPPAGTGDVGFGQSIAFVPDYYGPGKAALLAGMKYGDAAPDNTGTGAVLVFALEPDGHSFSEDPETLVAPDPKGGDGFGGTIVPLGDVDGDGLSDFLVGIAEHLEGDIYTGTQTGGVVFFH